MRSAIVFLLALLALAVGAITVMASPIYKLAAAGPTPGPLLAIGHPSPTPSPTPTPTPTPAPTLTAVTFNVPVYKQLRNLDCETAALQMALGALGINYTQNQLIAMQPAPDTRQPVMGRLSNGQKIVVQWGNPYKTFVGNIDGADLIPTGYGIYYPPLLALVQAHGVPRRARARTQPSVRRWEYPSGRTSESRASQSVSLAEELATSVTRTGPHTVIRSRGDSIV